MLMAKVEAEKVERSDPSREGHKVSTDEGDRNEKHEKKKKEMKSMRDSWLGKLVNSA